LEPNRTARQSLDIVQTLRAIAALAVTIVHFSELTLMLRGRWPSPEVPLYSAAAGVDLFFVISGFIMVYSSRDMFGSPQAPVLFFARRIARLVPLYWITTALAIYLEHMTVSGTHLLKSLFFIPYSSPAGIAPLYGVGWTLNYEMYFYFLFACVIALPRIRAVPLLSAFFVLIVLCGRIAPNLPIPLAYWSDPIVLEFVFGMGIASAYVAGFRFSRWVGIPLCCVGLLSVWLFNPNPPPSGLRVLQWGIPAAMVLAGAVLTPRSERAFSYLPKLLGDASYSIYLVHTLVIAGILNLWPLGLYQWPLMAVLVGGEVLVILLSICIFHMVERPMTRLVYRALSRPLRSRSTPPLQPAPRI
jgi:exopolysaccharide production protein ExoZ